MLIKTDLKILNVCRCQQPLLRFLWNKTVHLIVVDQVIHCDVGVHFFRNFLGGSEEIVFNLHHVYLSHVFAQTKTNRLIVIKPRRSSFADKLKVLA